MVSSLKASLSFERPLDLRERPHVFLCKIDASCRTANDHQIPLGVGSDAPLLSLRSIDSERSIESAFRLLQADEAARAKRFHNPQDASRFVFAHAIARLALASQMGMAPMDVIVARTGKGKPYLTGCAQNLHFSLSYRGSFIVLALSARPIGVDIERLPLAVKPAQIAERYFSLNERAYVFSDVDDIDRRFAHVWTRQEAVVKLLGVGLAGLGRFDVMTDALQLGNDECVQQCRLHSLVDDDYVLSVAA